MIAASLVEQLAVTTIGDTFNFYRDGDRAPLCRLRLERYLLDRADAPILLVGEAPGCRGARVSGIPFTSERQLTGSGPSEVTATIVHRVLAELGVADDVLLWNVVPTHPGTASSNRRPTREEIAGGRPFLGELARGRSVVAVGRLAHAVLGGAYVRHPSHGGAAAFRSGLAAALAGTPKQRLVLHSSSSAPSRGEGRSGSRPAWRSVPRADVAPRSGTAGLASSSGADGQRAWPSE